MSARTIGRDLVEPRARHAPQPHNPSAKRAKCRACGEWFWQWVGEQRHYCIDCSASRSDASIRSMRNKQGEFYERFVVNRYRAALAEMRRLGLTPGTDDP